MIRASMFFVFAAVVLTATAPVETQAQPAGAAPTERFVGLYVTRWDFRKPEHLRQIVADAESVGVTDIFLQVRGQADALYRSNLEPWCELLLDEGQTDPGFDPLAIAIDAAHKRGIRLHAWVNVMPLWQGATPPRDPNHLYHARPEFRIVTRDGTKQPLGKGYVTVNPVLPSVHQHLLAVIGDIARRYPVDGIHLDYIRFIHNAADPTQHFPADATSRQMFRAATDQQADDDPRAYRQWIASRITSLVAAARKTVAAARPNAMLSAAVWRNPVIASQQFCQEYDVWMQRGIVDAVMPMIYSDDDARFTIDLRQVLAVDSKVKVYTGIGLYKHEQPGQSIRQIARNAGEGADGHCLYAYASLFNSTNPYQDDRPAARAQRSIRLSMLRAHLNGKPGE